MIKKIMTIFLLMLLIIGFSSNAVELRYLYSSNGGLMGFYDDGKVRNCPKCDPIATNIAKMQTEQPFSSWYATDKALIWNNSDEVPLYDDEGISPEWRVFDSEPVFSSQTVTQYHNLLKDTVPDDALELKETTLVLITPPTQHFNDESSDEAQGYFTAMDDWSFYASALTQYFTALKVPVLFEQRHRFVITLNNGQRRIFDANHPQPEADSMWGVVLYRKGRMPIMLDITDSEPADAKPYLSAP